MPNTTQTTRAELVRRRRAQQAKDRTQAAGRSAVLSRTGPLVSRVRPTGMGGVRGARPVPQQQRRFEIALANTALRVPGLSALSRLQGNWRIVSLSLVILLSAVLVKLLVDPALFVNGINLAGASLVPGEEIYAASGTARQHIFWVDPLDAQKKVAAIPGIAAATVTVQWPNLVTLVVTERMPVLVWVEGEQKWWVDAAGLKFQTRDSMPGLLPITVDDVGKTESGTEARVPVPAIQGALQLRQLRPNIELLHYDAQRGLSYQDGRGWRGYFGVGLDMPQKLAVYETLTENLWAREVRPALVSVENVRAPYYRK